MPTNTANLNLFKYGSTDGARTFNIDEALNANWDKIDEAVAKKYTKATTGIPELDLDSAVKAALGKARTALQSVTKADVGLGNVDNTSDASKPISNAQATKFGEVEGALTTHQADLASQESGKGASLIGINDSGNKFTSTTVEGALGELFQFANDGKTNIATVVGSPTLSSDTFSKIKSDIQTQKNNLATNLTNKGQSSSGTETLKSLVDKVANVNTGKKWAIGTSTSNSSSLLTVSGLTFTPSVVIVHVPGASTTGQFAVGVTANLWGGAFSPLSLYLGSSGSYSANYSPVYGGFSISVYNATTAHNWIAIE